jgi:hypothetical protein
MNDEPKRMAGLSLGLGPSDIRAGFERASLRDLVSRARLPQIESWEDVDWAMRGAYQPREAFEV